MRDNLAPSSQINWLPVYNNSGEAIPAFAAMRISGIMSETLEFQVDKPNANDAVSNILFNGPVEIPTASYGMGTADMPACARYNTADGSPSNGDSWGVESGGWKLRDSRTGFLIQGVIDSSFGTAAIVRSSTASPTELKGLIFTSDTDSTSDSDPGAGLFKWNNATQGSATQLYFDNSTVDGISAATFFASLSAGGFLYLQQGDDSTIWQLWKYTAIADGTGYFKFTVVLQAKSAANFADAKTVYTNFGAGSGALIDISGRTGSVTDVTALNIDRGVVGGTPGAATFTHDDASATLPGDVNLSDQVMGDGSKTFKRSVVVNSDKNASYYLYVWGTATLAPTLKVVGDTVSMGSEAEPLGLGGQSVWGRILVYDDSGLSVHDNLFASGGSIGPVVSLIPSPLALYTACNAGHIKAQGSTPGFDVHLVFNGDLAMGDGGKGVALAMSGGAYGISNGGDGLFSWGVTATPGPGFQVKGGIVTNAGSGSFGTVTSGGSLTDNAIIICSIASGVVGVAISTASLGRSAARCSCNARGPGSPDSASAGGSHTLIRW